MTEQAIRQLLLLPKVAAPAPGHLADGRRRPDRQPRLVRAARPLQPHPDRLLADAPHERTGGLRRMHPPEPSRSFVRLGSRHGAAHRPADAEARRDVHDRLRVVGRGARRRRRAAPRRARRLRRGDAVRPLRRDARDGDRLARASRPRCSATTRSRSSRSSERLAAIPGQQASRAAIDAALHDLVGKLCGQPTWRILGLVAADARDDVHDRDRHGRRHGRPRAPRDRGRLPASQDQGRRRRTTCRGCRPSSRSRDVPVRVDANEGWDLESAHALLPQLQHMGVELVEQPFPADDLESFAQARALRARRADRDRRGLSHAARHPRDRALRRRRQHQAREERRHPRGGAHDLGRPRRSAWS